MAKYGPWLEPEGLMLVAAWARDGLTDELIAEKIGITRSTLYEWKKRFPDISDALKKGKEVVDVQVENALLDNALGYEYTEEVLATRKTVEYHEGKRIREIVEPVAFTLQRRKPAETTAQIFWLKNRRPKQWRDKPAEDEESAASNVRVSYNYEDDSDE